MNKFKSTIVFSLLSLIAYAGNGNRPNESDGPIKQGPGDPGGILGAPIDNYTIALIAAAVLIIAYVVYTKRQSKLA